MASKAGQRLTAAEVAEMQSYTNQGIAAPAKYDGVVFDNASGGEMHYRYATAEEEKAGQETAKREADALAADAAARERALADAAKRDEPAVPAKPQA